MPTDRFELAFDTDGTDPADAHDFYWTHLYNDEPERIQAQLHRWGLNLPHAFEHEKTHPRHVLVEDCGDFFHLVAYHLSFSPRDETKDTLRLESVPLHLVVHHRGVVSWGDRRVFSVAALHRKIGNYPRWIKDRAGLVFAILDELFYSLSPLLDELNESLIQFEQHAWTTNERKMLETGVMALKHVVLAIRSVLTASRDMAHGLAHRFPATSQVYYFDLYDHVMRMVEVVDGYREMLDTVMDLHLASVSNRMNEIVKTLTLVTTVMLPASLVAAIYGMNFDHAPGIHWPYGFYCVLGFVVLVSSGLLVWFKRQAWI